MHLAGIGLQDLVYGAETPSSVIQLGPVDKLDSLTALTRLDLHDFTKPDKTLTSRRTFAQLRELSLEGCRNMESAVFVPGALQCLKRLHIEGWDGSGFDYANFQIVRSPASEEQVLELQRAADVLLGLPQLEEVSGASDFFTIGIASRLPWRLFKDEMGKWLKLWTRS